MGLKLIFRNIQNHRPYSLLNLFGLGLGLCMSFIALLYVLEETGYDSFNSKHDRIVRVLVNKTDVNSIGEILNMKQTILFQEQIPEIEKVINFKNYNPIINEERVGNCYFAQADIVNVLDFEPVDGSLDNFLGQPDEVIVSDKFAMKYLGTNQAAGQSITLNKDTKSEKEYVISAVYKDFPKKSSLHPNMIVPIENYWGYQSQIKDFGGASLSCLFLLSKDADRTQVAAKMNDITKSIWPKSSTSYILQPLTEVHLYSANYNEYLSGSGSIQKVMIYAAIGGLILLISIANYLLLYTAITQRRLKEIAIRKTNGFQQSGILKMFVTDSLVQSMLASIVALFFMSVTLPWFNDFTKSNLEIDFYTNVQFVVFSVLLVGVIGLGSGLYFSNYINRYQVIHILKNDRVQGNDNFFLKHNAVLIQTTIVVFMLVFSMSMYRQIQFMLTSDKGYNEENLVLLPSTQIDLALLKDEAASASFIESAAFGSILPLVYGNASNSVNLVTKPSASVTMEIMYGDEDYIPTYQIELLAGRNFFGLQPKSNKSEANNNDKEEEEERSESESIDKGIILNETAVKLLELKDPIGAETNLGTIIGVMKDFKFESFKKPIRPMVLNYSTENGNNYIVKYTEGHRQAALDLVTEIVGEHPLGPSYLDNYVEKMQGDLYGEDLVLSKAILALTIIAILITIIGIVGMTMNKTSRMTKEIGIRKVNGADTKQIVWMLNKSFMKWVLIAFILAGPASYYMVSIWLQSFAYQVPFSGWMFALVLSLVVGITVVVVSLQSLSAATNNPVDALRDE